MIRLRRIEAVRFGALRDVSLGDLGDGLTVVYGPNEAGKSSLVALVRAVLYGFPRGRKSSESYAPAGGDARSGRLIFEGDGGRWVLERTDGPSGGPLRVTPIDGSPRPDLRDEICAGVSESAFRTVFGFGLDEMQAIESMRRDDDVIAPLHAAAKGLKVSPGRVREELRKRAEEIYAKAGRRKEMNDLLKKKERIEHEISDLRRESARFATLRAELEDRKRTRDELVTRRKELHEREKRLIGAESELANLRARVNERDEELLALAAKVEALRSEAERIVVDERVLERATGIDELVSEVTAFKEWLERVRQLSVQVHHEEEELKRRAVDRGIAYDDVDRIDASDDARRAVAEVKDVVVRLTVEREARVRELERADLQLAEARATAQRVLESLGEAPEASVERIEEIAARLEAAEDAAGVSSIAGSGPLAPAMILLVAGIVTLLAGIALREFVSAVIGGALALFGVVYGLRARTSRPGAGSLQEIAARRRRLELARAAVRERDAAERAVREARDAVARADGLIEAQRVRLAGILEGVGLPVDLEADAAMRRLDEVAALQTQRRRLAQTRSEIAALEAKMDAFIERVAPMAATVLGRAHAPEREEVATVVGLLQQRLGEATKAREQRERLMQDLAAREGDITARTKNREELAAQARALLERFDVTDGEALRDLVRAAEQEREAVDEELSDLEQHIARQEAELDRVANDDTLTALHVDLASCHERIAQAIDRYAVLSAALLILERAQETYEREQQPEVLRHAAEIFGAMTRGRYDTVVTSLDSDTFEVLDERAASKTTPLLSRGTREALFLALRLGLMRSMDRSGIGVSLPMLIDDVLANIDEERVEPAAKAIVDLGRERQVVFFTCHEHLAELLSTLEPSAPVLTLDRC